MLFLEAAGGLALFLWGIQLLSRNLAKNAGPVTKNLVARITGTPWRGFCTGMLATLVLQSSSLTTVMVVGMVNARMLDLYRALGIIIGANVGTTVTAQLLSFNLHKYALAFLILGFILTLLPSGRVASVGSVLLNFSLLLLGFNIMVEALAPLKEWEGITAFLKNTGEVPFQGMAAGFFTAALIQSSSAVAGIALAMVKQGTMTLPCAVALIIGADVGTCLTALVASIRMEVNARKAALGHLIFNLCCVIMVMPVFKLFVKLAELTSSEAPRQLANAHTLYNLIGAVILLPLIPFWGYMLEKIFKNV